MENIVAYTCDRHTPAETFNAVEGPVRYYGPADIKRCRTCGAVLTARVVGFTVPPDPRAPQILPPKPIRR
jgi:hypothetical protein